jgi:hypothetical protein
MKRKQLAAVRGKSLYNKESNSGHLQKDRNICLKRSPYARREFEGYFSGLEEKRRNFVQND